MLEDAANRPEQDVALLEALVGEPSGHIREVLRELAVSPYSLASVVGNPIEDPAQNERPPDYRRFVASPLDQVWALVSDPDRWVEWNSFEFERAEITDSGVTRAYARTRDLAGKPRNVKSRLMIAEYIVSRFEPPHLIQWERSFTGTGMPATPSLRVTLSPKTAGTDVNLTFVRNATPPASKPLTYWFLRSGRKLLFPVVARAYLRGKADNISRALRS